MEMQPFVKAHREENNTSNEKVQRKRVDILQDTMDEMIDETMPEEAFSYLQNL